MRGNRNGIGGAPRTIRTPDHAGLWEDTAGGLWVVEDTWGDGLALTPVRGGDGAWGVGEVRLATSMRARLEGLAPWTPCRDPGTPTTGMDGREARTTRAMPDGDDRLTTTPARLRRAFAAWVGRAEHPFDAANASRFLAAHADMDADYARIDRIEDVRVGDVIVLADGNRFECSGFDDNPMCGHRLYAVLVTTHTEQDFPVDHAMFDHALRHVG